MKAFLMREQIRLSKGNERIRILSDKRFQALIEDRTLIPPQFHEMLHILQQCVNGNYSQGSRLLGVSRLTYIKWCRGFTPPLNQYYWIKVIADSIELMLAEWRRSASTRIRGRAQALTTEYREALKHSPQHLPQTISLAPATRYLLSQFSEYSTVSLSKLRRDNRYSMSTLRHSAAYLGLDKVTTGFGANKETHYSLPEDNDDEDQ